MTKITKKYMVQYNDLHNPLVEVGEYPVKGWCVHRHIGSSGWGTVDCKFLRECSDIELLQAITLDKL